MKEPRILHNRQGQKAQANYPGLPQIPSSLIPHPCPPQFGRNVGFQNCVGAGSCHFGVCRGPEDARGVVTDILQPTQRNFFPPQLQPAGRNSDGEPSQRPLCCRSLGCRSSPGDGAGPVVHVSQSAVGFYARLQLLESSDLSRKNQLWLEMKNKALGR